MTLNEYQEKAMTTCTPSSNNFSYMMLNLMGEVGEFASKVAKALRKETGIMDEGNFYYYLNQDADCPTSKELYDELKAEAGDILWQLSGLCKVMGWNLEEVAQMNLDKLQSRQQRGVIVGEGDNR